MSKAKVEVFVNMYKAAAKSTSEAAEKVAEGKHLHQLQEGKGHVLWQVGHLAQAHDLIINQWILGGDSVAPAEYAAKFAPTVMGGGPVTANANDYPSWDEVFDNYKKTCAKTVELLEGLSDDDLAGELKGNVPEQAKSFFGNVGDSLLSMGLHETHHRGQIALLGALGD